MFWPFMKTCSGEPVISWSLQRLPGNIFQLRLAPVNTQSVVCVRFFLSLLSETDRLLIVVSYKSILQDDSFEEYKMRQVAFDGLTSLDTAVQHLC